MKNVEIAERIRTHLKRFEADLSINKRNRNLLAYWNSGAAASGRFVYVQYISYQGKSALSKTEALLYLAWLDAGNVGKHWELKN